MSVYKVWVEVEEVDDHGDHVQDWSPFLAGASIGQFDDLDEAVVFGDQVQKLVEAWELER